MGTHVSKEMDPQRIHRSWRTFLRSIVAGLVNLSWCFYIPSKKKSFAHRRDGVANPFPFAEARPTTTTRGAGVWVCAPAHFVRFVL